MPDLSLGIRLYSESDRCGCLAVFDANVPEDFRDFEREGFEGFLDDLPGPYLVGTLGAKIIGCGGYAIDDSSTVSMCWGMVSPEYQKRGFGRQLLLKRLELAVRAVDCKTVRLTTSHRVKGFFERMGFVVVSRKTAGIAEGLDECEMVLDVSTELKNGFRAG